MFEHIRRLVESRYRIRDDQNHDLPWQSVSAFCFLRFIVPAILHPHLFGLLPGTLSRYKVAWRVLTSICSCRAAGCPGPA